jgi:uncharacterized FlaG/YvyC family protein
VEKWVDMIFRKGKKMQDGLNIQQTSTNMAMAFRIAEQAQRIEIYSSDTLESGYREKTPRGEATFIPANLQPPKPTNGSNQEVDPTELKTALNQLNEIAAIVNEQYKFRLDQATGQLVVQITDQGGEVIRQVPPEAVLQLASKIGNMIGMFLDKNA